MGIIRTDTDKGSNDQHNKRDREEQDASSKNGVRDIVKKHHRQEASDQEGSMTANRRPMVHILVC